MLVVKWLHSKSGRSKRSEIVAVGAFMLEHDATGRFYLGHSREVSKEVDKQLSLLATGKHPHKLLSGLYERDNDIRVYEYPAKTKKAVRAVHKELIDTQSTDYLCLNPEIIK